MHARKPDFDVVWPPLALVQDGVVARRQLMAAGLTPAVARRAIDARRWRHLYPGVYSTTTGAVSSRGRVWAAVLAAGRGAVAGPSASLWLHGVVNTLPPVVDVVIPHERRVAARPGLRVHRARDLARLVHPSISPPRLTVEAALLLTVARLTEPEEVVDLVLRATQRRRTTAARLRVGLGQFPRHRWRDLLLQVLTDVDDGVASPLELRYARDVERAHGLPRGLRNARTGSFCLDVRYASFGVVVELDGQEAHPRAEAFRDLRRDNALMVGGDQVLRYGWRDVAGRPCAVAGQVAAVLTAHGWAGAMAACGRCGRTGKARRA